MMLTIPNVKQAIQESNWFATTDPKDAYFKISIWESHCQFLLRFTLEDNIYEFCLLPFGTSLAPHTFIRCVDAVFGPLWQEGLRILNYLDDLLVCARTEEQVCHHVTRLLEDIEGLGLPLTRKAGSFHIR